MDTHYDTPPLQGTTPAEQAASLVQVARQKAAWYKTNNVIIPFGSDFTFMSYSVRVARALRIAVCAVKIIFAARVRVAAGVRQDG